MACRAADASRSLARSSSPPPVPGGEAAQPPGPVDCNRGGNSTVAPSAQRPLHGGSRGRPHIWPPASPTRRRPRAATVAVTDLAGVYTYHNDLSRDGANTQEYALTTGQCSGLVRQARLLPGRRRNLRPAAMGGERRHQRHDAQCGCTWQPSTTACSHSMRMPRPARSFGG